MNDLLRLIDERSKFESLREEVGKGVDQYIKDNIGRKTIEQIAEELGMAKSSIDKRRAKLGLSGTRARMAYHAEIKKDFLAWCDSKGFPADDVRAAMCWKDRKLNCNV